MEHVCRSPGNRALIALELALPAFVTLARLVEWETSNVRSRGTLSRPEATPGRTRAGAAGS
jgi:hypothetical protein